MNNQLHKVTALSLTGGWEKDHLTGDKAANAPDLPDPSDPTKCLMNNFEILDDPTFPLTNITEARFQTSIPGRVTAADTGLGVPDAAVAVEGTDARGTTWGDGRLVLPILKEPFRKFAVTASAPGYAPWRQEIDFAAADAFPLSIALVRQPSKDAYIWVGGPAADAALAQVDSPRVRDLVHLELDGHANRAALVLRGTVPYGAGDRRAFLVFDTAGGSFFGVGEDGLHASSSFVGGVASDWAKGGLTGTPYAVPQSAVNYYSGHLAAWYVYSAGRLDAITEMMDGKTFDNLGHGHAMALAREWIDGMSAALGSALAGQAGVNGDLFRAGFEDALKAFDSNPAWRGGP